MFLVKLVEELPQEYCFSLLPLNKWNINHKSNKWLKQLDLLNLGIFWLIKLIKVTKPFLTKSINIPLVTPMTRYIREKKRLFYINIQKFFFDKIKEQRDGLENVVYNSSLSVESICIPYTHWGHIRPLLWVIISHNFPTTKQ